MAKKPTSQPTHTATDGYQPVKKGYQPSGNSDSGKVKGGYQPPSSEGGSPTNNPPGED